MLNDFFDSSKHLLRKMKHITVTNVCNLTCGGCHQHCGNFDKDQLWFMTPDDFEKSIEILKKDKNRLFFPNPHYITKISIFGGEPTIHPQWNQLMEIMSRHSDVLFRVSTNGRLGLTESPYPELPINVATLKSVIDLERSDRISNTNVFFILDPKTDEKIDNYSFVPTLVAPIDLYPHKTKKYFWYKAQRDCGIWKYCSAAIYNQKAYFCEVAAAMDHFFYGGINGWEITDKPFHKTQKEITEQAEKFCYRCGWCLKYDPAMKEFQQKIDQPTIISQTNSQGGCEKKFMNLVQIIMPIKNEPSMPEFNKQ